ncbi:LOW QUALITY PROTEIN: hypothetical protein TorRG33x02_060650 [Trema orientale]|uniref:Uncharacterized protein n=1 Tax=Trema orientale TaxID=63057 RepID=A0A2P5FKA9_TREOI|nr:LOW QUALITY PROTEIN: hypothetical protein TorRG33x02_060650 [Trema orientale]
MGHEAEKPGARREEHVRGNPKLVGHVDHGREHVDDEPRKPRRVGSTRPGLDEFLDGVSDVGFEIFVERRDEEGGIEVRRVNLILRQFDELDAFGDGAGKRLYVGVDLGFRASG